MDVLDPNQAQEDEVFFSASSIADPQARAQYLDQACARDAALRQTVEEMLASQDDADALLTRASSSIAGAVMEVGNGIHPNSKGLDEVVGTQIDRYKVLERLGEGGCGAVYLAEQEIPVRRRVALKVIKLGMDTKSVISRFETERQLLALMEHPNIARVFDAGATYAGRPYFVMELVTGPKITDYCDENRFALNERLRLFIQVCHAVQHAHQKGIIHRDLKPSNILVTLQDARPVPKVIDFGLAKAMEANVACQGVTTSNGHLIGTPAYMSPEQAAMRGVDVDTRSDIYSLGVLLYELLSSQTPFDGKQLLKEGLDEMRRTLRETEPKRPSAALCLLENSKLQRAAEARCTSAPNLISLVKGDLDWIVMKALEKDPARRYETAYGFLRDIERFLGNEPVVARPPTRIYRFKKLVRRNRIVFAAGTAVTLALAVGLGTSVWMLFRERELRQRAVAAEQAQVRLREVAERGLANEAELRRHSEAREAIVQAAALMNQQALAKSDELIARVPLENPTLGGVEVFRTLGDWHAVHGNWQSARDRFYQLRNANRTENTEHTSLDITRAGVSYIECDDSKGYEQFCQRTVDTYAGTTDPVVAERALKNCLLRPASESLLQALTHFAEVAKASLTGKDFAERDTEWRTGWCCLSLALAEYRSSRWSEAVVWSRRSLRQGEPLSRSAAAQAILAMALFRSGQPAEARSELAQAGAEVNTRFSSELTPFDGKTFWFDWVLARILVREAEATISQ